MNATTNDIVIERIYNAPIEKVWKAISEKEQLRQWYFDFAEGYRLQVGQVFEWLAGPPGGRQWLHRGKMLEIVEGSRISYSWEYPGYSGYSIVTWELEKIDEGRTRLTLTHRFITPFDVREEALKKENFTGGWDHILSVSLAGYIEQS